MIYICIMVQNIKLIDFNTFFNATISISILDTLHGYKLFKNNTLSLRDKDTKRFIIHLVGYHCLKILKTHDINKDVLIVQPEIISDNSELLSYFSDIKKTKKLILQTLKILNKQYPNRIVFLKQSKDLSNPDTIQFVFNKCNTYKIGLKL